MATAVQSGEIGHVIGQLPRARPAGRRRMTRAAFTTGLDRILLVAAIIALASGVVSLAAIRGKDFGRAAPGGQGRSQEMSRPDGQARRPIPAESQQPLSRGELTPIRQPQRPRPMRRSAR